MLTKRLSNLKAIISLKELGIPTKMKDLLREELLKGKTSKLDNILTIKKSLNLKSVYPLLYQNISF